MKTIIKAEEIKKYSIKKYRFGMLGSGGSVGEDVVAQKSESDLPISEQSIKKFEPKIVEEIVEPVEEELEETPSAMPGRDIIESLLKQNDELSDRFAKLEIQIQKQKDEYEQRLQSETQIAYEKGKEDGANEVRAEYEAKNKELESRVSASLKELENTISFFKDTLKKYEKELSDTAIEIAKEVIQKEIEENSSKIALSLSKALLQDVYEAEKIKIMVNPEDFEALKEAYKDSEHIEISPNEAVAKGGVIIVSNLGNIDGEIKTRLSSVAKLMKT
jgi:flagellar assembly protein FliH